MTSQHRYSPARVAKDGLGEREQPAPVGRDLARVVGHHARALRRPDRESFGVRGWAIVAVDSIPAVVHPRSNETLLLPSELRRLAPLASYPTRLQQSFSVRRRGGAELTDSYED